MSRRGAVLSLLPSHLPKPTSAWIFIPFPSDENSLKVNHRVHNRTYLDWLLEGFSSPRNAINFKHGLVSEEVASTRGDTIAALISEGERQVDGINIRGKMYDFQTVGLLRMSENSDTEPVEPIIIADVNRFPDFTVACSSQDVSASQRTAFDVAVYDCGDEEAGVYLWASKATLCECLARVMAKRSRHSTDSLEGPSLQALFSRACQDAQELGKVVLRLPGGPQLQPLVTNQNLTVFAKRHLMPLAFPTKLEAPLSINRLISHRGNLNGPDWATENNPDLMAANLTKYPDLQMEVDLWVLEADNSLWLGHDGPEYKIDPEWLESRKTQLVIHGKNILAAQYAIDHDMECFGHDLDEYVMTSKGWIWRYPRADIPITPKTIVVMPEYEKRLYSEQDLNKAYKVCTDYVLHLAGLE